MEWHIKIAPETTVIERSKAAYARRLEHCRIDGITVLSVSVRGHLECCVCGEYAGLYEQHWNRDTGYGCCPKCIAWQRERGSSEAEILDLYGVAGVNYCEPGTPMAGYEDSESIAFFELGLLGRG